MRELEKASKILDWYATKGRDSDLTTLLNASDSLAVISYKIAELLGDSQTDYNNAYFIRRISVSKTMNKLIKEGLAVSKADHESLEKNQEIFSEEKERESEAFKMNLLLKQINKVLDRMSQRISLMKIELQG